MSLKPKNSTLLGDSVRINHRSKLCKRALRKVNLMRNSSLLNVLQIAELKFLQWLQDNTSMHLQLKMSESRVNTK